MNRSDEAESWDARALAIRDTIATLNTQARPRQATRGFQGYQVRSVLPAGSGQK